MHPFVLLAVLVVGALILVRPRSKIITPLLVAFILIPMDQVLLIGGLHFPMLRFLGLFGIARMVWERLSTGCRIFSGGINKIDLAVISFALATALAGILLFQQWGALIFQLGNVYTIFSVYFLLRFLVRDESDIIRTFRTLAYVAAVVAVVMTCEMITGRNPYALLGQAQVTGYGSAVARADRFRATGCFQHPILAGTFGAILFPLFVALWQSGKKNRVIAAVGILSTVVITVASNSTTPAVAYASGVLALGMWPVRNWMRAIRWAIVFIVVGLHAVMKAPVWHLIARIDVSGGSSSYHRFMLVDQCIQHFWDWWLVGVKSTSEWGWVMWDTANQYVETCDRSGLLPFVLFLATITYGFKYLGKAMKAAGNAEKQLFLWSLGAALFANVVAFMGISYFDQTQVVWYGLLATISAAVVQSRRESILARTDAPPVAPDLGVQFAEFDENTPTADAVNYPAHRNFLSF